MHHQDDEDLYEEKRLAQKKFADDIEAVGKGTTKMDCWKLIAILSRVKNTALAAFSKPDGHDKEEWKMISMAVDSGAFTNVIDPSALPAYEVKATPESQRGEKSHSATGEEIPNMGEMKVPMVTREMSLRSMRFNAAPVTKPLGSVKCMTRTGI